MSDNSRAIIEKPEHHNLESLYLPEFLLRQRWFGAKDASIAHIEMHTLGIFESEAAYHLNIIDVELDSGEAQQYFLPLSIERGDSNPPDVSAFIDATRDEVFVRKLVNSIWSDQAIGTPYGTLRFIKSGGWDSIPPGAMVRSVSSEQTNDSFIVDERVVLKIYRRLWKGAQPEPEIAHFLGEAGYRNTPALLGIVEHCPAKGEKISLAALFAFVKNNGACWNVIVDSLYRALGEISFVPPHALARPGDHNVPYVFPIDLAGRLGQRTAEMHRAFSTDTPDPAFARELITREDIIGWVAAANEEVQRGLLTLERVSAKVDDPTKALIRLVQNSRPAIEHRLTALAQTSTSGAKTRIHGDYHLGQVLVSDHDVVIIDFEGEPTRPPNQRREKSSPLRDLAGMLRSFDYAAWSSLRRLAGRSAELSQHTIDAASAWRDSASRDFLEVYKATVGDMASYPEDEISARNQLEIFVVQKVFYEIAYEAANRPDWISIPLRGVLDLLSRRIVHNI